VVKAFRRIRSTLADTWHRRRAELVLRRKASQLHRRGEMLKVVIGAGGILTEGWLVTDISVLNALELVDWLVAFPRASIDRILAEHVVEHWTQEELRRFLRIVRSFLSADGFVRVAVPDGFHPELSYRELVRPGGTGEGADGHKVFYDYLSLTDLVSQEHYCYRLLEHFDEKGQFHRSPYKIEDGPVRRSAEHDPRNRTCPLSYTSLILDVWPQGRECGSRA